MRVILLILLFITPFQQGFAQENSLNKAREIIHNAKSMAYVQETIYPNPSGSYDTIRSKNEFDLENGNYKFSSFQYDEIFINNKLNLINHQEKNVKFFKTEKEIDDFKSSNRNLLFSKVELLNKNWNYLKDLQGDSSNYKIFKRIDTDTIINENSIKTEFFIYINTSTNLVDKFERRNYFKKELSQTIQVFFKEPIFSSENPVFDFILPENYHSEPFYNQKTELLIKKGELAFAFDGVTIDNKRIKLNDYKGKRILLVFSTYNCGYCQLTAEYISSNNFQVKEDVEIIYIKPLDSNELISKFEKNYSIKFPILAESKKIGEMYGVTGYPTFVELNEYLFVEDINLGHNYEFLNKYNQYSNSNL